jgi:hypothetical protein
VRAESADWLHSHRVVSHEEAIGVISAYDKDRPDPRFTDDGLRLAGASSSRVALATHLSRRVARDTFERFSTPRRPSAAGSRELHDETGSALSGVLLDLTAIDRAATLLKARQASAALRETARTTLEHPSTRGRSRTTRRSSARFWATVSNRVKRAREGRSASVRGGWTRVHVDQLNVPAREATPEEFHDRKVGASCTPGVRPDPE